MKINNSCDLVLFDLYNYDIVSCNYNILNKLSIHILTDHNNKLQRNIEIGNMQKQNPELSQFFKKITKSIIDEYILKNVLRKEDIICRQYDGLILRKKLIDTKSIDIDLPLRNVFEKFIISIDRKSFIAYSEKEDKLEVKGVSEKYPAIENQYKKLISINFSNKKSIFSSLEKIKNYFFTAQDKNLFMIPTKDPKKYYVHFMGIGEIEISNTIIKLISCDEIDRKKYFEKYMSSFVKSIVLSCF